MKLNGDAMCSSIRTTNKATFPDGAFVDVNISNTAEEEYQPYGQTIRVRDNYANAIRQPVPLYRNFQAVFSLAPEQLVDVLIARLCAFRKLQQPSPTSFLSNLAQDSSILRALTASYSDVFTPDYNYYRVRTH